MVAAMQIMLGVTSMYAHAVAATNNPVLTAFCPIITRPKTHRPLIIYPVHGGRRMGALYASVTPKPSRANSSSNDSEISEDKYNNVLMQKDQSNINIPNLLDTVTHDSGAALATAGVTFKADGNTMIEQKEELPQTGKLNDNTVLVGISLFLSLAVGAVIKYSPPGSWRYYLAGGICASTSHAITTPIDVVKTRQQVDSSLQEKSMWQATLAIVKAGGPFALLAGLGPTFIGYLIEGGVKFGIYEVSKPVTQRFVSSAATFFSNPALNSRIISLILCGFISGTAASMMLSPMEALRIRMVSDEEFSDKNLFDAGATMMKQEGLQSMLKGLPAMFWKQVPYTITKNASFDLFTMWLYGAWRGMGRVVDANIRIAIPLISALAAAVLSCISSHPGDMLLSLVNAHEGSKRTRDFAKEIMYGKDGIRGFFVGIKPRFLHVLMIVTVQLMIYDFVKRLVGIAATGMG